MIHPRLLLLLLGTALAACAGAQPRVLEVSHRTVRRTINPADEVVFVSDPASRIRVTPRDLPAAEQRQEFLVRWTPASIATVKLEYRRVSDPNRVHELLVAATGKRATLFQVPRNDTRDGSTVSAWRVSLWSADLGCLADQKSATW